MKILNVRLRSFTLRNFIEDCLLRAAQAPQLELRSFTLRNFIEESPVRPVIPGRCSIAKLYASQLH